MTTTSIPAAAGASSASVSRPEVCAISLLVLLFALLQIALADSTGVTVDEPSHLVSAHLYWRGEDRLQPGDMPPLIKLTGGWVPALTGLRLPPPNHPAWKSNHEWIVAQNMMAGLTAGEIDRVYFWSRLPLIVFPVCGSLLLWWWGRQLFGAWAGALSAAVFCLIPIVLGHGHLFKNDLAAAFTYLLFWYCAWAYWRRPSLSTVAGLALAAGLAICAKLSLVFLAPLGWLLILFGHRRQGKAWREGALALACYGLLLYALVIAAWQFDHTGLAPARQAAFAADPHAPPVAVWVTRALGGLPLPARLWEGILTLALSNAGENNVYLHGRIYPSGHPLYFLVALAVKTPVLHQFLILAGFVASLVLWRRRGHQTLFWIAPPLIYLTLASLSSLQLGLRLILPSIIFFCLWTGAFFHVSAPRRRWVASLCAALLMAGLGWRAATAHPHHLAFFNAWVGGPKQGLTWLTDSNLDWGQDLPEFADWVNRHDVGRIHLAYFGMDNPWAYLKDDRLTTIAPPWSDELAKGLRYQPRPGYYAISATLLTGQLFAPKYHDYFAAFRDLPPIAQIGYSIRIYEIRQ